MRKYALSEIPVISVGLWTCLTASCQLNDSRPNGKRCMIMKTDSYSWCRAFAEPDKEVIEEEKRLLGR
jgi:hypothetical protein